MPAAIADRSLAASLTTGPQVDQGVDLASTAAIM